MVRSRRTDSNPPARLRLLRAAPLDLYDYATQLPGRVVRLARHTPDTIVVTDDWPAIVPVTVAEVAIIEAYFGEVLDQLFGPLP